MHKQKESLILPCKISESREGTWTAKKRTANEAKRQNWERTSASFHEPKKPMYLTKYIYTYIDVKTTVVAVAGEVEKQKECTAESAKGKDRNLKQKQQN